MRAEKIIGISLRQPKTVLTVVLLAALAAGVFISRAHFDDDLLSLLPKNEQLRSLHGQMTREFGLHDMMVLGVVNKQHPDGVFNSETLKKVCTLSARAATWSSSAKKEGRTLASRSIIALDTAESIRHAGRGQVRFDQLMGKPPASREEALKVRDAALANPLLKGTVVSEDGKAAAIWVPVTSKEYARVFAARLRKEISALGPANGDEFLFSGLPIAEAFHSKELKTQLAFCAPLALLTVFLLAACCFFRSLQLAVAPVLAAACSALLVMGLLTVAGHALHSLSLLIPLFIMPFAVISVMQLLGEFLDRFHCLQDQRQAVIEAVNEQFWATLFIALTAAAGFAALAFSPLQAVQDFGLFVAVGLLLAWLLTILIVPACVMLIPAGRLAAQADGSPALLGWLGRTSSGRPWSALAVSGVLLLVSAVGLLMLQFSGNPIKWFTKSHEARVADHALKQYFGGMYDVSLILSGSSEEPAAAEAAELLKKELEPLFSENVALQDAALSSIAAETAAQTGTELLDALMEAWNSELDKVPPEDQTGYAFWTKALAAIDNVRSRKEIFKRPDLLRYLAEFQTHLARHGDAGKSNSISDLVKKLHQELYEGDVRQFTIPDTVNAVAETLMSFHSSCQPDDLFRFVTPDYSKVNLWLQLRNADSKSMRQVIAETERYFASHPPPVELKREWTGQVHVNLLWQEEMLAGLLQPLPVSIGLVFLMLTAFFRSPTWGLLAMMPLAFTLAVIFGALGLSGKDCDMPTVLLALLALAMVPAAAAPFLRRVRMTMTRTGDWAAAIRELFGAPARAVLRSIIVTAAGFSPLLFTPLTVPYQTAGLFIAVVMLCSGLTALWFLPALLTMTKGWIFKKEVAAAALKSAA